MAGTFGDATDVDLEHPAWRTALATAGGYAVLLGALFVVLFLIPYALFVMVG